MTPSRCRMPSSLRKFYRRSQSLNFRPMHNVAQQKTVVEQHILNHIKAEGPIGIPLYMRRCLLHPTHGYYRNPEHHVFGSRGDSITSNQIFGELLAIWFLAQYQTSGKDIPLRIIQLGKGTFLMANILRVFSRLIPDKSIRVHLVRKNQKSPTMRAAQQANIENGCRSNVKIHWNRTVGEILPSSTEYTMLVAHEFFNAVPIYVLQKIDTAWHEVLVDTNTEEICETQVNPDETTGPPLSFRRVLAPRPSALIQELGHSSLRFQNLPDRSFLEVSSTSFKMARTIGKLLTSKSEGENAPAGGCGLIIDYGGDYSFGDSFRAFRNHEVVDIFHKPGLCEFTANVDFAYLKEALSDFVTTHGPMPQGPFLMQLGLPLRLQGLLKAAKTDEQRQEIRGAAAGLVDPTGMGKEFQVMGITNKPSQELKSASVWPFPNPDSTRRKV